METFSKLAFKPEYKEKFISIVKAMIENNKNLFIKSEPLSGVMKSIGKISSDIEYKLYEYDFRDLQEECWEDELGCYFNMITRTEKMFIVFKNFKDMEQRLYNFLWTTNIFTNINVSFLIISDTNYENEIYDKRSTQINNEDFYYLLGINNKFIDFSINKMKDKYKNINIETLKSELKNSNNLIKI